MADYVSALTGPEMDEALYDMASHTSEAWAVGTRNDESVTSGDPTYNNNAKYWAGRSQTYNTNAQAAAARAEAAVPSGTAGAVFFDRDQSLTDSQKLRARNNLGAGSRPNLLRNWYWGRDQVVNTLNWVDYTFTSAGTYYYGIDGWRFYCSVGEGRIYLASNGIYTPTVPTGTQIRVEQYVENAAALNGLAITASIRLSDNTIISGTITRAAGTTQSIINDTAIGVTLNASELFVISFKTTTARVLAVKLEVGSTSSLWRDSPPDKETEKLKCTGSTVDPADPLGNLPYGQRTNPNLLVNGCFVGGIVINQRAFSGSTTASGAYIVDMWKKGSANGTIGLTSSGITLTGSGTASAILQQKMPDTIFQRKLGQPLTASYLTTGGLVRSATFVLPTSVPTGSNLLMLNKVFDDASITVTWVVSDNTILFRVISLVDGSVVLRQCKLETGTVSTIKNDIVVNRATEWDRCRFYYIRIGRVSSTTGFSRIGIAQNGTTAQFPNISNGRAMFKVPTVTITGTVNVWNSANIAITSASASSAFVGDYTLTATVASGLTAGQCVCLNAASGAYLELNAQPDD